MLKTLRFNNCNKKQGVFSLLPIGEGQRVRVAIIMILGAVVALALAGCEGKTRHFGEPFVGASEVAIEQLLHSPAAYTRKVVHVRGRIARQCPASGCWFFLEDASGHSLKVELGDYLPKLPINIGRMAEVEGELIKHGDTPLMIGTRVTFYDATAKDKGGER